jgi:restriction system protein
MKIFRIILGKKHKFFNECIENDFIGVDYGMNIDLRDNLPDNWREFNKIFIPRFLEIKPNKSRVAAGLACGAIHTISKGIKKNEMFISPNGKGGFKVGSIEGDYFYRKSSEPHFLRHCRNVKWQDRIILKEEMSMELLRAVSNPLTVINLKSYFDEISHLISIDQPNINIETTIENKGEFALESHLEEFLIKNWNQLELSKKYDLYKDEEFSGQQFPTDTGYIDLLAISKDKKELVVIELKKGRASDKVVGQIQRYMGYIKDEIATYDQRVSGIIIASAKDRRIERALSMTKNIKFLNYNVNFNLKEV